MSRTILLADDSLTIQKVVELTFADTEYEVVAVSSGDDLLQRLPEVRPDLCVRKSNRVLSFSTFRSFS